MSWIDQDDWGSLSDLDKARDWLEEILHQVYNIGNVQLLENALEELAAHLEVEMPLGEAKIQKKKNDMFDLGVQLMKAGRE